MIKAVLWIVVATFAFLALTWFAGAAAEAGLAAYVVVTWWSFGVLCALFALVCAYLALFKFK